MPPCSLRELAGYFLCLGAFGFGGPIALAAYMQRDLVADLVAAPATELVRAAVADLPPSL